MKDSIEKFLFRDAPKVLLEVMRKYFRMQVEGAEHLPKRGGAILAPNHSGYTALDAMILMHEVERLCGRLPRTLVHKFWFLTKATASPAEKLGFIEATTKNGLSELKKKRLVILFPEGEQGNFKPTTQAYQLQEFKRGFVRMAIETSTPIIPTMIIGAEETHINLSQLKFAKALRGFSLPLPLNVIPLPAKWKIKFLKPLHLPYKPSAVANAELMREIAEDIREQIQESLRKEIRTRGTAFF